MSSKIEEALFVFSPLGYTFGPKVVEAVVDVVKPHVVDIAEKTVDIVGDIAETAVDNLPDLFA